MAAPTHAELLEAHRKASATRADAHADAVSALESKISRERAAYAKDLATREAVFTEGLRSRYRDTRRAQLAMLCDALQVHMSERTFKSASAVAAVYRTIHDESVSLLGCEPGLLLGLAYAALLEDESHGTLGPPSAWQGAGLFALLETVARSAKVLLHSRPSAATERALDDLECAVASALESPRPGSDESRQDFDDLLYIRAQDREENDRKRAAARLAKQVEASDAERALLRRVRSGDLNAASGKSAGWLKTALGYLDEQLAGPLAAHLRSSEDI